MTFHKKSFASITGGLRKMVQDLRAYAMEKATEAERIEETMNTLGAAQVDCLDEADRSMETADNIALLIGEPTAGEQQ